MALSMRVSTARNASRSSGSRPLSAGIGPSESRISSKKRRADAGARPRAGSRPNPGDVGLEGAVRGGVEHDHTGVRCPQAIEGRIEQDHEEIVDLHGGENRPRDTVDRHELDVAPLDLAQFGRLVRVRIGEGKHRVECARRVRRIRRGELDSHDRARFGGADGVAAALGARQLRKDLLRESVLILGQRLETVPAGDALKQQAERLLERLEDAVTLGGHRLVDRIGPGHEHLAQFARRNGLRHILLVDAPDDGHFVLAPPEHLERVVQFAGGVAVRVQRAAGAVRDEHDRIGIAQHRAAFRIQIRSPRNRAKLERDPLAAVAELLERQHVEVDRAPIAAREAVENRPPLGVKQAL